MCLYIHNIYVMYLSNGDSGSSACLAASPPCQKSSLSTLGIAVNINPSRQFRTATSKRFRTATPCLSTQEMPATRPGSSACRAASLPCQKSSLSTFMSVQPGSVGEYVRGSKRQGATPPTPPEQRKSSRQFKTLTSKHSRAATFFCFFIDLQPLTK